MMKKKTGIIVASAVVLVAIVALLIFVFSGKNEVQTIDLTGVWKVTSNVVEGTVTIPQNEYMVFDGSIASDYRDGASTPYVTSKYNVSGDVLELSDISRTYHLAVHNGAYVSLYTSENTFMTIVKAASEEILNTTFDPSMITGKWNVSYRTTDQPIENEYLIFENGIISDYRNNSDQPTIEAEFQWNGNIIQAPSLGIEMAGARIAEKEIVLVDVNEGYVWILTKADD